MEAGQKCPKNKKEKHKTAFFSPSENWCLPAPSTFKPEEREFVEDSGASMHMISKKDSISAELETVTTSKSPTTVITATSEVQTNGEATVYVKELGIFLTMEVLEDTPAVLSLGKLCDEHGYSYEWINGQKPHLIKNGIRIQCNTENFVPIVVRGLSTTSSSSLPSSTPMTSSTDIDHSDHPPAIVSSESVDRQVRGDPYSSETLEWLQEFRENLVDDRVPEHRDSHASSSHESSSEPTRSVDLGKHSVYTHFLEDRNCDICQRTKITRAACRRRYGGAVPRAENFGGLITADHKVLSEGCESRNNHRYAVVVQDLATQWIQSYPCKTKTSQEHKRTCKSSWSRIRSLKSFTLTIPWNLAKPVKIFSGIVVRQHHTDRKQMGLLREQYAE